MKARDERVALMNEVGAIYIFQAVLNFYQQILGGIRMLKVHF